MWVNTVGASFRTSAAAGEKFCLPVAERHFGSFCKERKANYEMR